jgi:cytochrome bd ubiquinol oxidase subunit I
MDLLILSRLQFALTTIYHWLFVPLTLGLGWFVAYMQTRYYQTRDETWRKMAKFWGKLFLINFAIGTVTGIVQEFQFGMNWSEYSRFVGDIFGAPLAIEGLLAFFLESTFLGIWIFGEGRIPEKMHLASIWLVSIGSMLSALFILLANGFMQAPPANAYVINAASGRLEMVNFFALIGNSKAWMFFWHTLSDGLAMAAFLIIAVSAWHLVRKQNMDFFKRSFRMGTWVGLVAGISIFLAGHLMGQYMREIQPMKLAATEAIWESEAPASFSPITIFDADGRGEIWSIRIPYVMSLLACNNLDCEIQGINNLQAEYEAKYGPGNYIPSVVTAYWTFRIMMAFGMLMILLSIWFLWAITRRKDYENSKWLKFMPVTALVLPYFANASGWILTEMGRQPWIVYGLLKTEKGVSPNLTPVDLLISLVGFVIVYTGLAIAMVYLMRKYALAGPAEALHESVDAAPSFTGAQD